MPAVPLLYKIAALHREDSLLADHKAIKQSESQHFSDVRKAIVSYADDGKSVCIIS